MTKILYSPGYGAGWYSWNMRHPECLTDTEIIAAVEAGNRDLAIELAKAKWPDGYWEGGRDLAVARLPAGTAYRIEEYDGSESITTHDTEGWMLA